MRKEDIKADIKQISIHDALRVLPQQAYVTMGDDMVVIDDVTLNTVSSLPVQLSFFVIVLCTEGSTEFKTGGRKMYLEPGDLVISFGEQVVWEKSATPNFHAKAVFLSRNFAQNSIEGLNKMWPYLLHLLDQPVQHLTLEEQTWVLDCYRLIRNRLIRPAGRYMREAAISLMRAFFFEVCNLLDRRAPYIANGAKSRSYTLFDNFVRLASENFRKERSVEWYSEQMCITPKHLSEAVKRVSGKTAGQWITTLVIIEIKMQLRYSNLSIKEIAQELNFPNQSFLGKYFKNAEGMSPLQYRNLQ